MTPEEKQAKRERIVKLAMELLENGEDTSGICIACEEIADGVEPDASGYECECCGANKVYGAEQIILLFS